MAGISSSLEGPLLIEALIAFMVLRRTILLSHGITYSEGRIAITGVFYGLLCAVVLLGDAFLFPWWVLVADDALLVAVLLVMEPYARRHVQFFSGPGGGRMYRFPATLGLAYVSLFAVRTVVTLAYVPQLLAFGTVPPGSLSGTALLAIGAVDALFAGSTGLLFGRSIGVVRAGRALPKSVPAIPPTNEPLP